MATQIKEEVYSGDSEKQALSDKEVIETYLQDDRTKINAIYWANEFNQRFNGNWFTIEQVRKKTQFKSANEAHGILQVMCMLGLCHLNGETGKYKITLNLEQKLLLLTKEKKRAEAEKQKALLEIGMQYDMKIASLEREIERMSKVVEEVSEETEGK